MLPGTNIPYIMSKHYTIQDLSFTAQTIRMLRGDLTDMMVESCDEWIDEVKDLIKKSKANEEVSQQEVDSLVEWFNDICEEEAYPSILPLR